MDKKTLWVIVIVVLIVIVGIILIIANKEDKSKTPGGIAVVDGPAPNTTSVETIIDNTTDDPNAEDLSATDDVFNQLDESLEFAD